MTLIEFVMFTYRNTTCIDVKVQSKFTVAAYSMMLVFSPSQRLTSPGVQVCVIVWKLSAHLESLGVQVCVC